MINIFVLKEWMNWDRENEQVKHYDISQKHSLWQGNQRLINKSISNIGRNQRKLKSE